MNYQEISPPDHLKPFVQYFWFLEGKAIDSASKSIGPLADGCPGMMIQNPGLGTYFDQNNQQLPETFLYGQTISRTSLHLEGTFRTIGVRLLPNALKTIFGFDANELADSCLDLSLLPKKHDPEISQKLLDAHSMDSQLELLSSYLHSEVLKRQREEDMLIHYAVNQISAAKGNFALRDLQKELNLSERSLERRFRHEIGISPKLFSKICRFQAAWSQLQRRDFSKLSDIAFDNGYSDQSHFIRNFKQFAGFPPQQMMKRPLPLMEDFSL